MLIYPTLVNPSGRPIIPSLSLSRSLSLYTLSCVSSSWMGGERERGERKRYIYIYIYIKVLSLDWLCYRVSNGFDILILIGSPLGTYKGGRVGEGMENPPPVLPAGCGTKAVPLRPPPFSRTLQKHPKPPSPPPPLHNRRPLAFPIEAAAVAAPSSSSSPAPAMFGVVFPDRSFPLDVSSFTQIDPLHWVLDMNTFVGEAYQEVKEVCIFLLSGFTLPPGKALAVYVQAHGNPYIFCGAVHGARPSALLHLPWPDPAFAASPGPPSARIGVCLEDLASLPAVADAGALGRVERLALRVGENLFNFMQSFCAIDGNRLVVTADILDRWFIKFQERAKRDPEYLKSFTL